MVLRLHEDLTNLFSHGVFFKRFTLRDAIAVITNGFIFIVEIVAEHVSRVFRCADRLRTGHRHFAEVIDLPREDQGMIELLLAAPATRRDAFHLCASAWKATFGIRSQILSVNGLPPN